MKEKIFFNWLIPVLKLVLFVIFCDTVVFLLFGEHLSYDDVQKKTPRHRYSYKDYYNKRRSNDEL